MSRGAVTLEMPRLWATIMAGYYDKLKKDRVQRRLCLYNRVLGAFERLVPVQTSLFSIPLQFRLSGIVDPTDDHGEEGSGCAARRVVTTREDHRRSRYYRERAIMTGYYDNRAKRGPDRAGIVATSGPCREVCPR